MITTTHTVSLDQGDLDLTVDLHGEDGHPFLLLHGGGGPQTVGPFARLLSEQRTARVFAPVHPGFGGTTRPDWLTDVTTLARAYIRLLDVLDLEDVAVVGNSIGGWIAAEIAALGSDRITSVTLVNAVGIEVPGHPVADTFPLTPAELAQLSFHDPSAFRLDPAALSDEQRAIMAGNRAALRTYAGPHDMGDPALRERLAKATVPTLVAWGESDQVVDAAYGRAFAAAIPGARFELLRNTGHTPQIETPEQLLPIVWDFAVNPVPAQPDGFPAAR